MKETAEITNPLLKVKQALIILGLEIILTETANDTLNRINVELNRRGYQGIMSADTIEASCDWIIQEFNNE